MSVAAFVVSLIAIGVALISLRFAFRADRREETEAERSTRREAREEAEAAERRQGRPIVVAKGGSGGSTADVVSHTYQVKNAGLAAISFLQLWMIDGEGKTVSSPSGGAMALSPNEVGLLSVEVRQPLPAEQTLMVRWRDADREHEESTGIHPLPHWGR